MWLHAVCTASVSVAGLLSAPAPSAPWESVTAGICPLTPCPETVAVGGSRAPAHSLTLTAERSLGWCWVSWQEGGPAPGLGGRLVSGALGGASPEEGGRHEFGKRILVLF